MLTPDIHTRRLVVAERQASLVREAQLAAIAPPRPEERPRTARRVLRRRLRTA